MGAFQDFQSVVQSHVDPVVTSTLGWAQGFMEHDLGHDTTGEIFDAVFRPYQLVENQMETAVDGVGSAAQWVGTQVSEVMGRLGRCETSLPRCYAFTGVDREINGEIDRPRSCRSSSIYFYGGTPSYYPVFYQYNPMVFSSAISFCWQLGINPFLNPYMLMQMLMMLMMQQNMMFMLPFSFLVPQTFGIGIFLSRFS